MLTRAMMNFFGAKKHADNDCVSAGASSKLEKDPNSDQDAGNASKRLSTRFYFQIRGGKASTPLHNEKNVLHDSGSPSSSSDSTAGKTIVSLSTLPSGEVELASERTADDYDGDYPLSPGWAAPALAPAPCHAAGTAQSRASTPPFRVRPTLDVGKVRRAISMLSPTATSLANKSESSPRPVLV